MKYFLLFISIFSGYLNIDSLFGENPEAQESGVLLGPLVLFSQGQTFPAFAGLAPFTHEEARVLPDGIQSFQNTFLWFNTFRKDAGAHVPGLQVTIDTEGINWNSDWRLGLGKNLEISFQLQGIMFFPGVMDPFLSGFHQLFGFPNQSRELNSMNSMEMSIHNNGNQLMHHNETFTSFTQWSGGLKYQVPISITPLGALSAKLWYKGPIPSSSDLFFLTDWSISALMNYSDQVRFSLKKDDWVLRYGISGGLTFSPGEIIPLPQRTWLYLWGFHLGLVHHDWFLGAQGSVIQAPFELSSNYIGVRSGEVHLGMKGPFGPVLFEIALVEELLTWGTMEVGIYTGITWLW